MGHMHWSRGVKQQFCQASQHCSFNVQVTPFSSDHHWASCRIKSCKGLVVLHPVCDREREWWKSPAAEIVRFGSFQGTNRMEVAVWTPWHSPSTAAGGGPRNAQSAKLLILWIWRNLCSTGPCACAAPRSVSVQCRALSLCKAGLHARPIPLSWVSHIGPTPTLSSTCCTNTTVRKVMQDMDSHLFVLKVMSSRIAINLQNIHRAGGNHMFQNDAAKHRVPRA